VDCDKTEESSAHILYRMKDHFSQFCEKKDGWWGQPLLPEILGQTDPVKEKKPIFNRYFLVAPQP